MLLLHTSGNYIYGYDGGITAIAATTMFHIADRHGVVRWNWEGGGGVRRKTVRGEEESEEKGGEG